MIYKCRKKGIRIYSQVAINQMTFLGNDIYNDHYYLNGLNVSYLNPNWPDKSSVVGSPHFTYFGRKYVNYYSNKPLIFEYPAVSYYGDDFSCWKSTNDDLFKGWVRESLQELNTEKDYAKQRIVNLFAELLSVRITCFSIYNV